MFREQRKSRRHAPGRWTLISLAACLLTLLIVLAARNGASACPECHGAFTRSLKQAMEAMDREMGAAPMVGAPDRDFAAMMIPHHAGAIAMARAEIQRSQ
jgi:hypothetical protein